MVQNRTKSQRLIHTLELGPNLVNGHSNMSGYASNPTLSSFCWGLLHLEILLFAETWVGNQ